MLRSWSLRIDVIHVAPGLEVDVISQGMKQFRRFGSYRATTTGVVINTENNDECEARGAIVRLAN
jgi:hypothetical protein